MDTLTLSRLQFGTTILYHYLFVPLTMGLVVLIAIMETCYVRTGNSAYKRMAKFWGKLFLINFTMGVVTGIVQEFQFGMNWSSYSRFVGDVFGAPLAIEALLAFFMESTFLGIWIFGWEQLPKRVHLAMIWLVALGTHLSAFWILIANSFMQHPVGYQLANGRAEMTDFLALITNPNLRYQFPHVVAGALSTGAFFVVGVSAFHLLKKSQGQDLYQRSLRIGLIAALIGSLSGVVIGHALGQSTVELQPMKMAAAEGLWNTEQPASLSLISIIDEQHQRNSFELSIPYLLSLLDHNDPNARVKGILELQAEYQQRFGPGSYIPPVTVVFWAFRSMVGTGLLMALLSTTALFFWWRKKLFQTRWLLWTLVAAIALPYIANASGWVLTEMGRQPWLVFGLLTTASGVSPSVSVGMVLTSLILFVALYGLLAVVDGFLLFKYARLGDQTEEAMKKEEAEKEELVLSY
jgi:cytochrome d ubiquinol oxidase subunit I